MQQTTKYQFNLIEGGDDFSPDPLNENMEKVEAQFSTVASTLAEQGESLTAAMAEQTEGFAAALGSGGKNCRVAVGSYVGTGAYGEKNPISLTFDFCPAAVIVADPAGEGNTIMVRSNPYAASIEGYNMKLTWGERSVSWCYNGSNGAQENNVSGVTYHYVVLGYTDAQ